MSAKSFQINCLVLRCDNNQITVLSRWYTGVAVFSSGYHTFRFLFSYINWPLGRYSKSGRPIFSTRGEESKSWKAAIQTKINALTETKTWTVVPRTEAHNIRTSTSKHRARLVGSGFQRKERIDYEETVDSVIKCTTLRMFLAAVAFLDLHGHQMYVKTAFHNGDLDRDVHIEQPEGCMEAKSPDYICKLQKAQYGLKKAPRQ